MNCYLDLNLPSLFRDSVSLEILLAQKRKLIFRKYVFVTLDFQQYLNQKLIEIFKSIDLTPLVLIIFGHENDSNFSLKPMIHSDAFMSNTEWISVPASLNFELTLTNPEISWYDVGNDRLLYDLKRNITDPQWLYAGGIHYSDKNLNYRDPYVLSIKPHYKIIEKKFFDSKPTLIRTNVPHSVQYHNYKTRLSASIRFPIDQIDSWETACNKFKNFIL